MQAGYGDDAVMAAMMAADMAHGGREGVGGGVC